MGEAYRCVWFLLVWVFLVGCASPGGCCSTRWLPCYRPPPPRATPSIPAETDPGEQWQPGNEPQHQSADRPPIVFETKECPEKYNDWYCLNGATCFMIFNEYYCNCSEGFMGIRCEDKYVDLERTISEGRLWLQSAELREMSCLAIPALILAIGGGVWVWVWRRMRRTRAAAAARSGQDQVDGIVIRKSPFGPRHDAPLEWLVRKTLPR